MRDPFAACSEENPGHSCRIARGGALHRKGESNSSVVPPFQESPRCVSPSRGTGFPCTALTFKLRIDSHHVCTWDSPVGKPRGKTSRESHRSLDPCNSNRDTDATARRKAHVHAPIRDEDLLPWGDSESTPRSMSVLERNPQVPAPTPHKDLGPGIDGRGIPRGPRTIRMGTGQS